MRREGTSWGMTLSSEEHPPGDLVALARRAEEAGFGFVSVSDHYHPWVSAQGHSPFVWSVLGGIAAVTERVEVGVGVTCPIVRIHPAIVAHAAATASVLLEGRLVLGVGTGEALNEHVTGARWPSVDVRREMLEESVEVMRRLWLGETVDHRGRYYEVENAKLFDPPVGGSIPVVVSGFGPQSVELAARIGDGYWGTSPDGELVGGYREAGGDGPTYGQLNLCWGEDEQEAARTVHRVWPNAGLSGQLSQDLPTWTHFEQAVSTVSVEEATKSIPCGPALEPVLESVRAYLEAGYDHVYFHQIGPDQEGFLAFWERELRPALADLHAPVPSG